MKRVSNKFSLIREGKSEESIVNYLKNELFRCSTLSNCKKHGKNIKGTLSKKELDNLIKRKDNCCFKILISDLENFSKKDYEDVLNRCKKESIIFIYSNPCIEINLLTVYEEVNSKLSSSDVFKKLKKHNHSYDKSSKSIRKIFSELNNKRDIDAWLKRLHKLNSLKISNFIELCKLFKGEYNG